MRFDEVSALYAQFGPFYLGVRLPVEKLEDWLLHASLQPR
jgi:chlorite dismutase